MTIYKEENDSRKNYYQENNSRKCDGGETAETIQSGELW